MAVTLRISDASMAHIADLFAEGVGARPTINLLLSVVGPVTAYFLCWGCWKISIKPGPKTLWGNNPDGELRVMTKTAPSGFIRVNRDKYREIARDEIMTRLSWKNLKISDIPKAVEWGLRNAAPKIADLIAETAPYDTGALRDAIRAATSTFGNSPVAMDMMSVRSRIHVP
jgi:hypothetical protein